MKYIQTQMEGKRNKRKGQKNEKDFTKCFLTFVTKFNYFIHVSL